MDIYPKFGALSSSVDPNKLAATVTGIIKSLAAAAAFFGYSQIVGDVESLAEIAGQMAIAAYGLWGLAESAFGLLRKVVVAVTRR